MGRKGINRSAIKLSDFFGSEFIDWVCKDGDFLAVEKIPGSIKDGAKESILWGETKRQMNNALSGFNVRISNGESPILVATDPEQAEVDGVVSEQLNYLLNSFCHRLNNCQLGGNYPPIYSLGSLLIFLGANNVVPKDAEGIKNTTLGTVVLNIAKLFSINIKDALRLEPGRVMTFYPDPEEPLVFRLGNRNSQILLKTLAPRLPRDYATHWAVGLIEMVLGIITLVYPKIERAFAVCGGDNSNLSYQRLKFYAGPDSEGRDQGLYISTREHEKGIYVVLKARESANAVALFEKKLHRFDYFPKLPKLNQSESYIGFELEMEFDNGYDAGDNAIEMYDIASRYNLNLLMKSDGSLSEDGVEIVSLPMASNIIPLVNIGKFLLHISEELNAEATSCCGLHFHISSAPYKNILANTLRLQEGELASEDLYAASAHYVLATWFLLAHFIRPLAGRENNSYCKYIGVPEIKGTSNKSRGLFHDRYTELNISEQNTFELRLFQATTDISKFTSRLLITREFDRLSREVLDIIKDDIVRIYNKKPGLSSALDSALLYMATIERRIGIENMQARFAARLLRVSSEARALEVDLIKDAPYKVRTLIGIAQMINEATNHLNLTTLVELLDRNDIKVSDTSVLSATPLDSYDDDDDDEYDDSDDYDADDDDDFSEVIEEPVSIQPQQLSQDRAYYRMRMTSTLDWVNGFMSPTTTGISWEMAGVDRTGEPEWRIADPQPDEVVVSGTVIVNNTEVEL